MSREADAMRTRATIATDGGIEIGLGHSCLQVDPYPEISRKWIRRSPAATGVFGVMVVEMGMCVAVFRAKSIPEKILFGISEASHCGWGMKAHSVVMCRQLRSPNNYSVPAKKILVNSPFWLCSAKRVDEKSTTRTLHFADGVSPFYSILSYSTLMNAQTATN